jgi:gentisate 1,2-dioxygenase
MPVLWNYDDDIRPLLLEAGRLITAKEATRRVLVLENPGIRGTSQITQSLYAGVQMILPGEIAPTHRHTASAIRFIVEGSGAYTAVDGERTTMHPGDFILTPSWTFHDHGNPGTEPCMWIDGLDFPLVNMMDTAFAETYPEELQPVTKNEGDSLVRFGANMLPIEHESQRRSSPIFNYPYARTRVALDGLYRNGPVHPCHGVKVQFVDPSTGSYPMPAIAAFMQLLPAGFRSAPHRSTDSTIFSVVEGRGRTRVGETTLDWKDRDIFVTPSWYPVIHEADTEAVLFSFSDRPAQKALALWREQAPIT